MLLSAPQVSTQSLVRDLTGFHSQPHPCLSGSHWHLDGWQFVICSPHPAFTSWTLPECSPILFRNDMLTSTPHCKAPVSVMLCPAPWCINDIFKLTPSRASRGYNRLPKFDIHCELWNFHCQLIAATFKVGLLKEQSDGWGWRMGEISDGD